MNDKRIWKYKLNPVDIQTVKMPAGSVILSCQVQDDVPCLWAKVEPELKKIERVIEIIGTGTPISESLNIERVFIDTVQLHGGSLVFHVFERVLK